MEILFLGTSSGVPTKQRNVSAIVVKKVNSKSWCLIDCGEGTQHQILYTDLSLNHLQAIFITHVHGDHCYGLPGLLASAAMSGRSDTLYIVAPPEVRKFIEYTIKMTQMKLNYQIRYVDVKEDTTFNALNDLTIETVKLSHRVPSYAYCFIEKNISGKLNIQKLKEEGIESGPVWKNLQKGNDVLLSSGKKLKSKDFLLRPRNPRKVIVAGDNDTPELLAKSAKMANVLIHEATYTADVAEMVGEGPQHSTAKNVSQFAWKHAIPNLILTHFSPRYQDSNKKGHSILEIESEAKAFYDGNLFLAKDFDFYQLKPDGELKI